jgi:prevent-host-death family protein
MKTVSAAEANRSFSKLLGGINKGEQYTITSHGKPVAQLLPIDTSDEEGRKELARLRLFEALEARPVLNLPRFTRDEIYDYLDE